jgi:hypothetical protein
MAGLLDLLQSASNTAASNVSAPVDGIAWLLRKAGIPVPQAPLGGSDWMQAQGLTRPVEQSGMSLAGETLGLLAPVAAAAKAPQIAQGLLKAGENASIPRQLNPQTGAIVYHGSPHKFDAFDSSKIGTGEGAQAYGHGLYLADHPDVALNYAPRDPKFEQKIMSAYKQAESRQMYPVMEVHEAYLLHKTPQEVEQMIAGMEGLSAAEKSAVQQAQKVAAQQYQKQAGALYKVDLPDEQIAKMIDWDKPIKDQPIARDMLRKAGFGSLDGPAMGREFAPYTADELAAIQEAGIPGMRYLDEGSRNLASQWIAKHPQGGENQFTTKAAAEAFIKRNPEMRLIEPKLTNNYVVFPGNEGLLSILERNGKPLR